MRKPLLQEGNGGWQMISDVSEVLIVHRQRRGVTNLSNGALKVENVEEWTPPSSPSMVFSPVLIWDSPPRCCSFHLQHVEMIHFSRSALRPADSPSASSISCFNKLPAVSSLPQLRPAGRKGHSMNSGRTRRVATYSGLRVLRTGGQKKQTVS